MHILHINSEQDVDKIDKLVKQGKDVFILVYMVGCGPCNATRPEWEKLSLSLKDQYANNDKLVIIDVNKDFLSQIKSIGAIDGFPTIKYIGNHGNIVEQYEKSSIKKKDRSVNSFINWIETKINNTVSTTPTSSAKHVYNRLSVKTKHNRTKHNRIKHNKKGGKWTRKYKAKINCKRPKGFSQRQYCKYGRNK